MKRISSMWNHCFEYIIKATKSNQGDLDIFLAYFKPIYKLLRKLVRKYHHIKFHLAVNVKLGKFTLADQQYMSIRPWFVSPMQTAYARGNKQKLLGAFRQIIGFYDGFIQQGSGWMLEKVLSVRVKVARYKPFTRG